jgi:hypothetical protein
MEASQNPNQIVEAVSWDKTDLNEARMLVPKLVLNGFYSPSGVRTCS